MTQPGTLGTENRPTIISTDLLGLLGGEVDSLLGLGIDAAQTQDGVIVFSDDTGSYSGTFGGEVVYYEDGTGYPVQSVEYVDSGETARPVSEWHLGPKTSVPDSAIYRFRLDDIAGGSVQDSIQGVTGTNNDITSVSGNYVGGSAGEGDGTNAIVCPELVDWTTIRTQQWSAGFTVDDFTGASEIKGVVGCVEDSDESVSFYIDGYDPYDAIAVTIFTNGDLFTAEEDGESVTDGNKHRCFVGLKKNVDEVRIYTDNVERPVAYGGQTIDRTNTGTLGSDTLLYDYINAWPDILDDIIIYDQEPTDALAQADYDLQPWT